MAVVCPKCRAEGKYYYDGVYIECRVCGHKEWAKEEASGHITNLYEKWRVK